MRLALSLWALVACSGAPGKRDVQSGCTLAMGALELCGEDCAPALDVVRAACTVLAGGRVDACQVALQARRDFMGEPPDLPAAGELARPDAGSPGPPGGASLPSAPPGAPPTDAPSAAPGGA